VRPTHGTARRRETGARAIRAKLVAYAKAIPIDTNEARVQRVQVLHWVIAYAERMLADETRNRWGDPDATARRVEQRLKVEAAERVAARVARRAATDEDVANALDDHLYAGAEVTPLEDLAQTG